jgi:hypothetical protein
MAGPFDQREQGGKIPWYQNVLTLPGKLINDGLQAAADGFRFRFGGLLTYEKPIVEFPGDIIIPVASNILLMAGTELPRNCVGLRFINLIPNVVASINGYPFRIIQNNDVFSGCEIRSIQISTDIGGTCTIQAVGTGD